MLTPSVPVMKPRRCLSQSAANQAYNTQAPATITVVSPQPSQETSTPGARKMTGTLNSSNQDRSQASNTRAAAAAVGCQSRPAPHASEMKEQSQASSSRAGIPLGTGCQIGA